ncbi:MAG: methyltransferase domain-containing protein, partial [Betaproteobacteria bacterium]
HGQRALWDSITNGLIDDVLEANESFDVVWMDNSLEHTFDPLGTMLTAYRLLRKGGALLIFVPNSEALIVKHLDQHMYWGHWFLYRPLTLFRMLARIGFSVTKLHASQTDINLELRRLVDVGAVGPALKVMVPGPHAIERVLDSTPCYSDFFSVLAVKPEDGPELSQQESELREIARNSLLQRAGLDIRPDSENLSRGPNPPAIAIASLNYRIICESSVPLNCAKVYFVENGVRRWVLSTDWLAAQGFCFLTTLLRSRPICLPSYRRGRKLRNSVSTSLKLTRPSRCTAELGRRR